MLSAVLDTQSLGGLQSAVVAVSGGSDSLALLHLLHEAGIECHAVTIDHRLRQASTSEADFVKEICSRLGVSHSIISRDDSEDWSSQSRARNGRYEALATFAQQHGLPIFTGHTMDDDIETLRMRIARGGGTLGLSGIAPISTVSGTVKLIRPLLKTSRASLRSYLAKLGVTWVEDPSNNQLTFERIRVRKSPCPTPPSLLKRYMALNRAQRTSIMQTIAWDIEANLKLGPAALSYQSALQGIALIHAVRIISAWYGNQIYLPSQNRIEEFLNDGSSAKKSFTIAGTCIVKRSNEIRFTPDPRNRKANLPFVARNGPLLRFRSASDDPVHHALNTVFAAKTAIPIHIVDQKMERNCRTASPALGIARTATYLGQ